MSYYTSRALSNLGNALQGTVNATVASFRESELLKQKAEEAAIASQQNRINEYMNDKAYNEKTGFVYELFKDGDISNIDQQVSEFWNQDALIENMVANIGVSKEAGLKWFEDNGQNFKYYLDQNVTSMTTDYNRSVTLANYESDSAYLASNPSMTYESMLEAERQFYVPVKEGGADPTGEKNPDLPINRHTSGIQLLQNKIVSSATDAVKFGDGYMTEDEFVAHFESEYDNLVAFANAGYETEAWKSAGTHTYDENYITSMSAETKESVKDAAREAYVTAYSEQSTKVNNQVVDIVVDLKLAVGRGEVFDEGYFEAQVQNAGLNIDDPMVRRAMAEYDPTFRAKMTAKQEEEETDANNAYMDQLKEAFTNYMYAQTQKKERPTEEGFKKWLDDEGIDSSYNEHTNDFYSQLASSDWEYEASVEQANEKQTQKEIKESEESKQSTASYVFQQAKPQIKKALNNGSLQPKAICISSDGISTEPVEGSTLQVSVESMMGDVIDGTLDISVYTPYGAAVEQIAKENGIKDPYTLMYLASLMNKEFTLDDFKNDAYGEIFSKITNHLTYPDDKELTNAINTAFINDEITESEQQDLLKLLSLRENSIADNVQTIKQMINEAFASSSKKENDIKKAKADIGFDSTLSETLVKWLQANPNASNEEMRLYANSIVNDYANNEFAKHVRDQLRLIAAFGFAGKTDFNSGAKDAKEAYKDYLEYGDYFISAHPEGYKMLSLALKGGTKGTEFTKKSELLDFAAQAFFGPGKTFDDLTDSEKNNTYEAIGISLIELQQYRNIEKTAYATEPEGYKGPDWCKEVRLADGRVGILNRNGLLFSSNGSDGACRISLVDKESEEFKDAFSANPLGLKFAQPFLEGYSYNYKPTILNMKGKVVSYRDLTIEELRRDLEYKNKTGYYGIESMLEGWGYGKR